MSLSLRDLFAAHVAASLATRVDTADAIAAKSYDLAEALLRERARREGIDVVVAQLENTVEDDELAPVASEPTWLDFELGARGASLLDEPAPVSERDEEPDPRWLAREERDPNSYDPRWDADPVVIPASGASADGGPPSQRPGLARTAPGAERSAPGGELQRKEKTA